MNLSVKEQVIQEAINDPFLTVSELAELVNTTSRYVRTILSEAGLSLHKLREDYAKDLERRLGVTKEIELEIPFELKVSKVKSFDLIKGLGIDLNESWFKIAALEKSFDFVYFTELYTDKLKELDSNIECLRDLLPYSAEELEISKQRVEVVSVRGKLPQELGVGTTGELYRITTFFKYKTEVIAYEIRWLPLADFALEWTAATEELQISSTK